MNYNPNICKGKIHEEEMEGGPEKLPKKKIAQHFLN